MGRTISVVNGKILLDGAPVAMLLVPSQGLTYGDVEDFVDFLHGADPEENHEEAYNRGYDEGKRENDETAYDEGYEDGKDDGYDKGYKEGHDEGYEEGHADGVKFAELPVLEV